MRKSLIAASLFLLTGGGAVVDDSRDYISIVGSSTVYPFSTVVAEQFGRTSRFKTPKVESTGSGGGIKLFCAGVGTSHPDITNASRRIKASEVEMCAENGVEDIVEVRIGYDGIVLANAIDSAQIELTRKDIFLALAKETPGADGTLVDNPNKLWSDIRSDLPASKIEVYGPPPTSGTRDAFVELAMEGGCKAFPSIKALKKTDKSQYKAICHSMREDGVFIEAGENDNLIVQKLQANPNAFGIFGFSFLDQNYDVVQGALIDGTAPEFETIADGSYPISRPLFFYLKKAHVGVVSGLEEFIVEFTSESTWGEDGYLSERGLIPLPTEERAELAAAVRSLKPLQLAAE